MTACALRGSFRVTVLAPFTIFPFAGFFPRAMSTPSLNPGALCIASLNLQGSILFLAPDLRGRRDTGPLALWLIAQPCFALVRPV
jgi:hypothetical protein